MEKKTFILTDEVLASLWLNDFRNDYGFEEAIVNTIPAGEQAKTLSTIEYIFQELVRHGADKSSVLVNFGGGVISDLGGFAASVFCRGIDFINVPTTLLSMIDASIGGKNGIDFRGIKNLIGTIRQPKKIIIDKRFLSSLPPKEILSGIGEILKYGLILDKSLIHVSANTYASFIERAAELKKYVVTQDPEELSLRKILNFGHTIGHAVEAVLLRHNNPISHGEAVAFGSLVAVNLSVEKCRFSKENRDLIFSIYKDIFSFEKIKNIDHQEILEKAKYDKKNRSGQFLFVLLENFGRPIIDVAVDKSEILKNLSLTEELLWKDE